MIGSILLMGGAGSSGGCFVRRIIESDDTRVIMDCPRKLVHGYEDRVWFNKSRSLFRFNVGSAATGVEAEQPAANSAGVSPLSELCGRRWL